MKIWVYLGDAQQGPFDLEQLRQLPITAETPVWYEGLEQWTPAGDAPATRALFGTDYSQESETQTIETEYAGQQSDSQYIVKQANAKTFLGWSIALTICCCGSPFSLAALVGSIVTIMRNNKGDEVGAKKASEVTEWLVMIAFALGVAFLPIYTLLSLI